MVGPLAISKDAVFHILQNSKRRAVMRYLLATPRYEQFMVHEVVEQVAAWEYDTTVGHVSQPQRQHVSIQLYQTHLPMLDDHGVITFHPDRDVIESTPLIEAFEPYLENNPSGGDHQSLKVTK